MKKTPTVAKPVTKTYPRYEIDWKGGFATECTEEELQIIRDFQEFLANEFPHFVGDSKINRIAFCDPNIQLDGVSILNSGLLKGAVCLRSDLN